MTMTENTSPGSDNFKDIFLRIGQLTRVLRNSMANLGLEQALQEVAEAFPNTPIALTTSRQRLPRLPTGR